MLDKSRGVGGRAATRRIDGQPVDHGLAFYHGSHPEFLEALEQVDEATLVRGWPAAIEGSGRACNPSAFRPGHRRLAYAEGLTAFPKHLAKGLDVRGEHAVEGIELHEGELELHLADGGVLVTDTLVVALPVDQMMALAVKSALPELERLRPLFNGFSSEPCLTAIAGYPLEASVPEWHIAYPESSEAIVLASHDSTKRVEPRFHAFVFQGRPKFSREYLEAEPDVWRAALLDEASALFGDWAGSPSFVQTHRWRFARAQPTTLTEPVLVTLSGGARIGLTGELFSPGGGVEAAWLAGRALARRLLER